MSGNRLVIVKSVPIPFGGDERYLSLPHEETGFNRAIQDGTNLHGYRIVPGYTMC